jgi:hypothetical protein
MRIYIRITVQSVSIAVRLFIELVRLRLSSTLSVSYFYHKKRLKDKINIAPFYFDAYMTLM